MKVRVDRDLCIGVGNCVGYAPTVLELDQENKVVVLDPSSVDDTLLEATRSCTQGAMVVGDKRRMSTLSLKLMVVLMASLRALVPPGYY